MEHGDYGGHICKRCGQKFPRSENLRRHLARKNPCVDNGLIRNNLRIEVSTRGCVGISSDPLPPSIQEFTDPVCPFCGKRFTTITNRNKHTRYVCRSAIDARILALTRCSIADHLTHLLNYFCHAETITKEDAISAVRSSLRKIGYERELKNEDTL